MTHSPRSPHTRARRGATLLSTALLMLVAACGGSGAAAPSDDGSGSERGGVLNVGQLGAVEVTKALLEAAGEADTDYEVSYSLYPAGGPAFLEAVPSGSVDVASMADTPPIFGQVAGIPTKIIAVATTLEDGQSTVEILAPEGTELTSVADLAGKKVATTQATILQYTLLRALEQEGLRYEDVEIVNLSPPDAVAAFDRGDVDAITALDPQLAQLKARGAVKIGDGVGLTSGFSIVVATEAALADGTTSANIEDFVQRVIRAEQWGDENVDEWAEIFAEIQGLDPEIARAVVSREKFRPVPIDRSVIDQQQAQADAYTELGLIPEQLDVSLQFDDRFNEVFAGGAR